MQVSHTVHEIERELGAARESYDLDHLRADLAAAIESYVRG